jgi:hypothetical protein
MSMETLKWAYGLKTDPELRGPRKAVLAALAFHANKAGECWPKQATLASECGVNKDTVTKALAWLEENDYLKRERQYWADGARKGYRKNDLYTLNLVRPRRTKQEEELVRSQRDLSPATPMSVSSDAGTKGTDEPTTEPTTSTVVGVSTFSSPWEEDGSTHAPYPGTTDVVGRASDPPPPSASKQTPVQMIRAEWPDLDETTLQFVWSELRATTGEPEGLWRLRLYAVERDKGYNHMAAYRVAKNRTPSLPAVRESEPVAA